MKKEIYRKISHLSLGTACLFFVYFAKFKYSLNTLLNIGIGILVFTLILEHLRIERGKKIFYLSSFVRGDETDRLHHFTYTLLGALLCLAIFEFKIAFTAISMAIYGDAAAAFARFFTRKKKIIWAVMTLVSLLIAFTMGITILGIPMAMTASLIEVESYKISDNLAIPLFAGGIGHLLHTLLKVF